MRHHLAAAIAAFTISACGGGTVAIQSSDTTPAPETTEATTTTTTTAAPRPATRPTITVPSEPPMNGYQPDVYLDAVLEFAPYWYYSYEDNNLIDLGLLACQNLDDGLSIERLLFEMMDIAYSVDPALNDSIGTWLRAVVRYICPEHFSQIADS